MSLKASVPTSEGPGTAHTAPRTMRPPPRVHEGSGRAGLPHLLTRVCAHRESKMGEVAGTHSASMDTRPLAWIFTALRPVSHE